MCSQDFEVQHPAHTRDNDAWIHQCLVLGQIAVLNSLCAMHSTMKKACFMQPKARVQTMFLLTHRLLHSLPAQAYILLPEQFLCVPGGSTGTWLHAGVLSFLQTNSLRVCPQTPEYVEDVDASYRQNAVQNDDVDSCGDWGDVRTLCWDELNTPQLESFSGVLKSHQQERPASLHGTSAACIISVPLQASIRLDCPLSAPIICSLTSC